MYSGNRAKKLAKSVKQWVAVKSGADNTPREAGWVTTPHLLSGEQAPKPSEARRIAATIATIESRGIKRFLRQVLHLSGKVIFFEKKVVEIVLNPLYPLIDRIKKAFEIFLRPYEITVSLAKT